MFNPCTCLFRTR